MDFKTALLTELLECGEADISFLEREIENFNIDISEINWKDEDFNSIIAQIYVNALSDNDIDSFGEEWESRIEIFTNYIDSHLWVDGEEMMCADDIEEMLSDEF